MAVKKKDQNLSSPVSDALRAALFEICNTPEELHQWVECYLGIDLPAQTVHESSNSNPLMAVWTVYDVFRSRVLNLSEKSKYSDWSEVMAYASRDSFKTLGAAVLEVIVMLHFSLSVAHMAAIEQQSKKAQQYVKSFFNKPFLKDFVTQKDGRRVEVTRFVHKVNGNSINEKQYNQLPSSIQMEFERKWTYIRIILCTLEDTNSEHVPFFVVDEVDVIRGESIKAYEESKLIPTAWQGIRPLTLYISTRKSTFGLVQQEIDKSTESGLQLLHWNIIDVTEACPPERHLPEEPKIPIYYHEPEKQTKGHAISEEAYEALPDQKKEIYRKTEGYAGCLKNCKLFFACKGALATKQSNRKTFFKKEIDYTVGLFRKLGPGMANAQLLCLKPSEEGLIYPRLDEEIHKKTAPQIAKMITGEEYPENFSKLDLLRLMEDNGAVWIAGIDHGYTHWFAVTTYAKIGNKAFVIDFQGMPELELDDKILLLENTWRKNLKIEPERIYADTAEPDSNNTLKRKGKFHITPWTKGKDSVVAGIEILRMKIQPAVGDPEIFFLADDPGVDLLFKHLIQYHWQIDKAGRYTNIPSEENDDGPDSIRYGVMNEFMPKGGIRTSEDVINTASKQEVVQGPTSKNYLKYHIDQALGINPNSLIPNDQPIGESSDSRGKKGRLIWNF